MLRLIALRVIKWLLHLHVPGQRDNNMTALEGYEDEFHELNYYNGRGASSRALYDSQHSRIVPLASRLLGLSFPPPLPPPCASRAGTRHVAIIHTLCTD